MRILARLGLALLALLLLGAVLGAWGFKAVLSDLPDVASLRAYRPAAVTTVWSRDGELMAEFFEERRKVVDVATLPSVLIRAFVAAEDSEFFQHEGLDWKGIVRAAWANVKERRVVQGGSTITQQVAKSLLLSPERSFRRKLREAVLAVRIERNLSKQEILHLYLNQIYLGHGAHGIGSASEIYFGIPSQKLSLAQAALLAGLPQAPSRYDPYQHPERALERRRYVLDRMVEEGWVTPEQGRRAVEEPVGLAGYRNPYPSLSPYFSAQVRRLLETRYGHETVLREGLRVVTTMDSRLQAAAQRALRRGLEAVDQGQGYRGPLERVDPASPGPFAQGPPPEAGDRVRALVVGVEADGLTLLVGGREIALPREGLAWALPPEGDPGPLFQPGHVILCDVEAGPEGAPVARLAQEPEIEGALVCMDPSTGEVLACVGGYDFERSEFNRATQAQRQPGSAIKPLIYAAALSKGLTPATLVHDSPIVYDSPDLEHKWKPRNYSERFYGATTLREALVRSRNVVTVKILREIGVPYAVRFLHGLGIRSRISPDLSLALGASTVSLLELVDVYAAFPTGGVRQDPAFLLSVEDRDGNLLEAFAQPEGEAVLGPEIAYVLTHMMQAVIREGTGRRAHGLERPAAGKTGTTNDYRDAWFLGFTADRVAGVWVGYDDGRSLGRRQSGGRVAAPIWLDFMREATEGLPRTDFPAPEGIEFVRIDALTGRMAGPASEQIFTAAFQKGTAPPPAEDTALAPASSLPLDPKDPSALDALR